MKPTFAIKTFRRDTSEEATHFIPAANGLEALKLLDDRFAFTDTKFHQHMEVHNIRRV